MELEIIKVATPLGAAILVIWWIVRAFLISMKEQRDGFLQIVTNHLHEDLEMHKKTIEAIDRITDSQKDNTLVMREVLNFLKRNGNK